MHRLPFEIPNHYPMIPTWTLLHSGLPFQMFMHYRVNGFEVVAGVLRTLNLQESLGLVGFKPSTRYRPCSAEMVE